MNEPTMTITLTAEESNAAPDQHTALARKLEPAGVDVPALIADIAATDRRLEKTMRLSKALWRVGWRQFDSTRDDATNTLTVTLSRRSLFPSTSPATSTT